MLVNNMIAIGRMGVIVWVPLPFTVDNFNANAGGIVDSDDTKGGLLPPVVIALAFHFFL
jgi:hypothetical protein